MKLSLFQGASGDPAQRQLEALSGDLCLASVPRRHPRLSDGAGAEGAEQQGNHGCCADHNGTSFNTPEVRNR